MPLWKREEIQKMLRRIVVFAFAGVLAGAAHGAVFPDELAGAKKTGTTAPKLTDQALWEEYGFTQAEQAVYEGGGKTFTVTGYRFKDSTGALAAFQWQQPADARPSKLAKVAVETNDLALIEAGNYLLKFENFKPQVADLNVVYGNLPKFENSPLPMLPGYLPDQGLVPNSERYVLGPASLEKFAAGIRPSIAELSSGAEAQVARYKVGSGEVALAIFSYPTPQFARQRLTEFQNIAGAAVKRSGPLVAVILNPPDRDAAERLLGAVRYQAEITLNERTPTVKDNVANLILNIFILIGILLGFTIVGGLAVGGGRVVYRRLLGRDTVEEPMTTLHLADK